MEEGSLGEGEIGRPASLLFSSVKEVNEQGEGGSGHELKLLIEPVVKGGGGVVGGLAVFFKSLGGEVSNLVLRRSKNIRRILAKEVVNELFGIVGSTSSDGGPSTNDHAINFLEVGGMRVVLRIIGGQMSTPKKGQRLGEGAPERFVRQTGVTGVLGFPGLTLFLKEGSIVFEIELMPNISLVAEPREIDDMFTRIPIESDSALEDRPQVGVILGVVGVRAKGGENVSGGGDVDGRKLGSAVGGRASVYEGKAVLESFESPSLITQVQIESGLHGWDSDSIGRNGDDFGDRDITLNENAALGSELFGFLGGKLEIPNESLGKEVRQLGPMSLKSGILEGPEARGVSKNGIIEKGVTLGNEFLPHGGGLVVGSFGKSG